MSASEDLNLIPALVESGHVEDLINSGQTLSVAMSPFDNSLVAYVANATTPQVHPRQSVDSDEDSEQPIYFANIDSPPSAERRLFITDTLIIFAAFQNLLKTAVGEDSEWLQGEQSLMMIRKLGIDYVNFIKECWVHSSQPIERPEGLLQYNGDHYRSLYTCFSLFVVLYMAEPGYENAPVGDELMEWLNIHFIEPSTEEGDQLSSMEHPWEDDSFWPYLTRTTLRGLSKASIFFIDVLFQHPSEQLQELAQILKPLVDSQPRLQNFTAERDFAYASRRWNDKVKALRIRMDRVPEADRFDDFENWWDRLSDIVGILEGRPELIQRVCLELGADWKEVCAAWGVFVDTRLRRQDLTDVVAQVLSDMPPDPTNLEDMIHAALFSGQPVEALNHAAQLDRWLAAHMGDIMEPLSLIDSDVDEDSGLSIRDRHILAYAEYLHSDPTLWRITVDYMYSCGVVGKNQADEILLRVPLKLHEQTSDEPKIRSGDVVGVLKEVNETCFQYQREAVRRTVCKIAAQTLIQEKDYGLAISYCTSAEDWLGLGRVVDRVLDEYIYHGSADFSKYASAIAPSIQDLQHHPTARGVFFHRLMFAAHYAHFHQMLVSQELQEAAFDLVTMFHDQVVPKSWWAILLCDSVALLQHVPLLLFPSSGALELLSRLDEIFTRTSQGCGVDYLAILMKTTKMRGEKEALERLKIVRLALAKYFARCAIISDEK
ncbi:nucleoporin Nup85-like protein [Infundibulicybe gibba]|nr:nucleoporin Nup85-like protein [Infundibulicybe gibba]